MTTRPFWTRRTSRIKDVFGAVLLILTALLYFEDTAGAQAIDPECETAEVVAER